MFGRMSLNIVKSILGGIGSAIANAASSIFDKILSPIIQNVVVPFVEAAIQAVIYTSAGFLYTVSSFLLNIIDFLEMLFRSLAGLQSVGGDSITFSMNGGSGDLLIQMITSEAVLNAFYSTAIVGIFLLIIMTIFQMIKVEYTTEGAENNKTKIMGKSLKSLSNLILIPALCVFGVFIGNQILDLIDTATRGDSNARISGTLFVTAASNAMYHNGGGNKYIEIENSGDLIGSGIGYTMSVIWPDYFADEFVDASEPNVDEVETNVAQVAKGYRYYDLSEISKYYNVFELNYLVLIFGACIILKCLFNVCFGLVDRLYRCVALFIVAPFVIGMSPVKDSLASWRSSFIGKAISAYGAVIAINLFFTIVGVLLNVNIDVDIANPVADSILNATFCEGLVKSIFVIVGCLMIEKLAAEMGNYFGASDGMGTGKALAGEATAGLAKAAQVGVGIASGGASLAMRAGKGIAGAVGKTANFVSGGKAGELADKVKSGVSSGVSSGKKWLGNNKLATKIKGVGGKVANDLGLSSKGAQADYEKVRSENTEMGALKQLSKRAQEGKLTEGQKNTYGKLLHKYGWEGISADRVSKFAGDRKERLQDPLKKAKDKLDAAKYREGMISDAKEKMQETGRNIKDNAIVGYSAIQDIGAEGRKTLMPKTLSNLGAYWDKHAKAGSERSEYTKAAYARIKGDKADAQEARFEGDPVVAAYVRSQQRAMNELLQLEATKRMEDEQRESNNNLKKLQNKLDNILERMKNAPDNSQQKTILMEQASGIQSQMLELNGKLEFDEHSFKTLNLDSAIEASDKKVKAEIDNLKKILQENQGKSTKDILKALEDHMATLGKDGDDKMMKAVMKALEEIKANIGK